MASVYKRGKVWWGRAQYKGKEYRQSLDTGNKATAESRLAKWLEDLRATSWGGKQRVTVEATMRQFILEHLPTLKPNAATRYLVSIEWLVQHFEGKHMDEIGRAELSGFENWRRAMGRSSGTIRRDFACLSSAFTFAEDREWVADGANPVPSYLRRRSRRGLTEAPGRKRYLSEDDEALLLAEATPAVAMAICLAIDTGLRHNEMFTLEWRQVDLKHSTISTTLDTKSGRSRNVPLPERSRSYLAQIRAQGNSLRYVFAHAKTGERIKSMDKGFRAAARRAELTDLRWHDLRRTAGCRWLQRDRRSIKEVSEMLGHSSSVVTEQRYAFLASEQVAREIAAQKPAHGRTDSKRKSKKNKAIKDRQ